VRTVFVDWLSLPFPLFGSRLGASLPSFVVAFALALVLPLGSSSNGRATR
jgi:hypothetical protein